MRTGYLEEPLQLSDADQSGLEQDSQPKIQSSELKHLFEKQELQRQEAQGVPKAQRRIKEDLTPKSEHKTKDGRVIISKEELQVKRFTGADMEDAPFMEQQMLEDAQSIYANYLEDVKAGKEVIIKTPEERLKEKKKKDKSRASKLKKING